MSTLLESAGQSLLAYAQNAWSVATDSVTTYLSDTYQAGLKWLFYVRGSVDLDPLASFDVTVYFDLADYFGVSPEGRGDGGQSYVTTWVDGAVSLGPIDAAPAVVASRVIDSCTEPVNFGLRA
jgi:hypothetical protein